MRRPLFGLALAALLASAQAAGARQAAPERVSARPSVSPFALARLVGRGGARRERGLAEDALDLRAVWGRLGVPAGFFETCGGWCEARLFLVELDGEPGAEVLLKLTTYEFCRYLVFKRAGRHRWRLLGLVDHDFNRYQMSRHRVARAGGRNWLVVGGQEGSGSGFSLYAETWYEVSRRGVRGVLNYLSAGHVAPCLDNLGRSFTARARGARRARAVHVRYAVSYEISDCSGLHDARANRLFDARHRVRYVWDERARAFAYDGAGSDVDERGVALIANAEPDPEGAQLVGNTLFFPKQEDFRRDGYDLFLKYNLAALRRVAARGDARRREWLRAFLARCRDGREKETLLRALRR